MKEKLYLEQVLTVLPPADVKVHINTYYKYKVDEEKYTSQTLMLSSIFRRFLPNFISAKKCKIRNNAVSVRSSNSKVSRQTRLTGKQHTYSLTHSRSSPQWMGIIDANIAILRKEVEKKPLMVLDISLIEVNKFDVGITFYN